MTGVQTCALPISYFKGGIKPVSIWVSQDYTRASRGGTGTAKCGGNYAASLSAQAEAYDNGCDQVVFLDAVEQRWIEDGKDGSENRLFMKAKSSKTEIRRLNAFRS